MRLTRYEQETIINLFYISDKFIYLSKNIIRVRFLRTRILAVISKIFSDNILTHITSDNPDNPDRHPHHLSAPKHGKLYNLQDIYLSVPG